jgi:hypothetical protein
MTELRGTECRKHNLEKEIKEKKRVNSTNSWNRVKKPESSLGQQVRDQEIR